MIMYDGVMLMMIGCWCLMVIIYYKGWMMIDCLIDDSDNG